VKKKKKRKKDDGTNPLNRPGDFKPHWSFTAPSPTAVFHVKKDKKD